jgi:hypothetical protein
VAYPFILSGSASAPAEHHSSQPHDPSRSWVNQ